MTKPDAVAHEGDAAPEPDHIPGHAPGTVRADPGPTRRPRQHRHHAAQPHSPPADAPHENGGHGEPTDRKGFFLLCMAALGVVYGDIGTSPLYAVNDIFFGHHPLPVTPANALGAASLIFWIVTVIVTIKYVTFVLRVDHHGEGGTFSLLALVQELGGKSATVLVPLLTLAAGMLYGEGLITPAISVVSAVEGLKVATEGFAPFVVPITIVILTALFAVQYRGTESVGRVMGPVVLIWFVTIAALGLAQIIKHPGILAAIDPRHAVSFLTHGGVRAAFVIMGSVLLAVTGGEALFADMGHFGRKPIQATWKWLVFPALLLNYLGQGAFLYGGEAIQSNNVFYSLVPRWGLYPMVALATAAAIIASQALITGAFSLTQQAMALGLFPRFGVVHTSGRHEGQIYVPMINRILWLGCILLVLGFQESTKLASAYGLAVAGVMFVTSLSMFRLSIGLWNWPIWKAALVFGPLAVLDFAFLSANSLKFKTGGWVPFVLGVGLYIVMTTWKWGRAELGRSYTSFLPNCMTVDELISKKLGDIVPQLPRSIVFMASRQVDELIDRVPPLLQIFHERYGALPKHVIFLTVVQKHVPFVRPKDRHHLITFHHNGKSGTVMSVQASYGYMERPAVRHELAALKTQRRVKVPGDPKKWLVLAGQENVLIDEERPLLYRLRMTLFRVMLRNSLPAWQYFGFGADSGVTTETIHITPTERTLA